MAKMTKNTKLGLMFFIGTIFFATGLVIYPSYQIELYQGNHQSPFIVIGLGFFLLGSFLAILPWLREVVKKW